MSEPTATPDDRPQVVYLPGLDGTGRLLHRQPGLHALYRVDCVSYPHGLDLRPRLGEVRAPALVIASPNDKVVPCRAGRDLARQLPRARLLLARVGHAALIHPRIDLANLLADEAHWPGLSAADRFATR